MEYILDVDSNERDYNKYPNSNDFTINLNRPLYNVSDFRLISANIPITQLTINEGNRNFEIDGTLITLDIGNYTDPHVLAADIQSKVSTSSNVDSVVYNSKTGSFTFSNTLSEFNTFSFNFENGQFGSKTNSVTGTPATLLGFGDLDIASSANVLTGGVVDLHGPTSLLLRITSGLDGMKKKVYSDDGQSLYTARIMTSVSYGMMFYKGPDDPVDYYFQEGRFKSIEQLRFQFYYINGSKLIPYNFGNRNYSLKFKIKCSLDKLESLIKHKDICLKEEDKEEAVKKYPLPYLVGVILIVGLLLLVSFNPRRKLAEPA